MAALKLTPQDRAHLIAALDLAIASANRAQNTKGKTPQMKELHELHERDLEAVRNKIQNSD